MTAIPVLTVENLRVEFNNGRDRVRAVNGVSFAVYPRETVAIVGESGSGKSVTVRSLFGLLPSPPARVVEGRASLLGLELFDLTRREHRRVLREMVGMIFQDPIASLNPVMRIGDQVAEALARSDDDSSPVQEKVKRLLDLVGIPDPALRIESYPHQFSGGMRQRVMIAMAIAKNPALLVADEPTTALDVTIQAQILRLLDRASAEVDSATLLITHDLGVVAEMADRVLVMYAGSVVEEGRVDDIFDSPRHPYTAGLLQSLPRLDEPERLPKPIPGRPPRMSEDVPGCPFAPRCELSAGRRECLIETPTLTECGLGHRSACHFADEVPELLRWREGDQ